ncbi:hypothetical protein [Pedobacter caeni]|uniref:DNA-binding beta-propeller fold protein YncE n=1 Tax=Pedobacter caeni TaxID=288992 RepID=A0A1M4VLI8_9SPHI|nr:hypothetical protein [Pedobacter caeni]SHE69693.1 hypothetical protein SAMN04488522_101943 [Pedobacter caeni]
MLNKQLFKKILLGMIVIASVSACKKDKAEPVDPKTPETTATKEFKYLRVLVADELSNKITQVDPFTGTITSYDAKYPLATLYGTANKRYATVIYQKENLVEIFDTGLQSHQDHVDVDGSPKWASISATAAKPTHYKSVKDEVLIFNDSEGTLSLGKESDFHTVGAKFKIINAGLLPHHGAMANFDNGTIAVTTTASAGAAPTKVIVIDKDGKHIHPSKLEFGNIHGNASDGGNAVFGGFTNSTATAGGVLVVKATGEQRVIPNPDGFGAFRLASIYYADAADKFVGFVATKGAYLIDIKTDKISPIYAGNDVFQCKLDYAGKNLLLLTLDGKLRIYNLSSGQLTREGTAISAVTSTDTYKPVIEATAKFAYISLPASGEVVQIDLTDFRKIIRHKVSSRPVKLALTGFESNAGHND